MAKKTANTKVPPVLYLSANGIPKGYSRPAHATLPALCDDLGLEHGAKVAVYQLLGVKTLRAIPPELV